MLAVQFFLLTSVCVVHTIWTPGTGQGSCGYTPSFSWWHETLQPWHGITLRDSKRGIKPICESCQFLSAASAFWFTCSERAISARLGWSRIGNRNALTEKACEDAVRWGLGKLERTSLQQPYPDILFYVELVILLQTLEIFVNFIALQFCTRGWPKRLDDKKPSEKHVASPPKRFEAKHEVYKNSNW